ncbi:MAG TPA: octaprenyl diphosphate synthase [Steroidobacteraceae bacterium]|jgi:octaprenyl-diphosphate synthase|nr:octaprenyl diphosphate synthase [Steroidobacteraceae bacterium]
MPLEDIRALVRPDLVAVDAMIRARLKSTVPLVDQVAEHIIGGGGKRLRPLLCVLAGRACGIDSDRHVDAAVFIEFVHTATLLHDDVVDGSQKRRGRATANNMFGNQVSVLVGDFVYSRAFQMMANLGNQRVMEIMADATNVIAEGEVLQLMNAHDPETTEQRYLEVIYRKTGRLFEAGAEVAAVLAGANVAQQAALARYGKHLGTAYQLIDDVLDYRSDPATRGKNLGDDLAEGKPTLPLLHALRHGNDEQRALIRLAIEQGGLAQLGPIVEAIEITGGLDYAVSFAQRETQQALDALQALPDTPFSRALAGLARFAQERTS